MSTTFSDTIKAERARLGISQAVTAWVLGVSLSTVANWERGRSPNALTQSGALAVLAGIQPGDPRLVPGFAAGD
jgi:DNA-binding transcriptional regulator YiaG